MFLLDTNIVSELRKPRPHGAVVAWAHAYSHASYLIPSIVVLELQAGVEVTRRQNPAKADELDDWINEIMATKELVPLDASAARLAARLLHGRPSELTGDAMIAAIAKERGLVVATRNVRDFQLFDVPLINPFLYNG